MKKSRIVSISIIWIVFLGLILFETSVSSEPTSNTTEPKPNATSELFFEPIRSDDAKLNETEAQENQIGVFLSEDFTTPFQEIINNEAPTKRSSGATSGASVWFSDGTQLDLIDVLSARLLFAYLKVFIGTTPPPRSILQLLLKPIKALVSDFVKILSLDELQCNVRPKVDINKWHPVIVLQSVLPGYDQNSLYEILTYLRENQNPNHNPMPWSHLLQILDPKKGCGVPNELWSWISQNQPDKGSDDKQSDSHEIEDQQGSSKPLKNLPIPTTPNMNFWHQNHPEKVSELFIPNDKKHSTFGKIPEYYNPMSQAQLWNLNFGKFPMDWFEMNQPSNQQWPIGQNNKLPLDLNWNTKLRPPGLFGWTPNLPSASEISPDNIHNFESPIQDLTISYQPNLFPWTINQYGFNQPQNQDFESGTTFNPNHPSIPKFGIENIPGSYSPDTPSSLDSKYPDQTSEYLFPSSVPNQYLTSSWFPNIFGSKPHIPQSEINIFSKKPSLLNSYLPWTSQEFVPDQFSYPQIGIEFYPENSKPSFNQYPVGDQWEENAQSPDQLNGPDSFKPWIPNYLGPANFPNMNYGSQSQINEFPFGISDKTAPEYFKPSISNFPIVPEYNSGPNFSPQSSLGFDLLLRPDASSAISSPMFPETSSSEMNTIKKPGLFSWIGNLFKPKRPKIDFTSNDRPLGIKPPPTKFTEKPKSSSLISNIFNPQQPSISEMGPIAEHPQQSSFWFPGLKLPETLPYEEIWKYTEQPEFNFIPESSGRPRPSSFMIPGFGSTDSNKPGEDYINMQFPFEISGQPTEFSPSNMFGSQQSSSQGQPGFNHSPESSDRPTQPFNIPGFGSTDTNKPGEDFINLQFPSVISGQPTEFTQSNMFGPQPPSSLGQPEFNLSPESSDKPMQPFKIPGFGSPDSVIPGEDLTSIKLPSKISTRPIGSWLSNIFGPKHTFSPGQPEYNFMTESTDRPSSFMIPGFGSTDSNKPGGGFINMQFPFEISGQPITISPSNMFGPQQPSSQEQPGFNLSPESSDRPMQPFNIPGFGSTDTNKPGGDFINLQFPSEISGQPIESSSSSMFGPQQPSLYGQPGFNFKPESFDRPLQLGNIPGFSSPDSFKPGQDWTNIKLPSEISSRPIGSWLLNIFGLKHPSSQGQPGFNYSPESSDRPTQPFNIPGFGSTDSNKPEGDFINMQFPFEISGQPITISPSNMFGPQLPSSKGQLGIDFLPESPDRPMQPFNIPGFGSTDTNKPGGDFINLQFPSEISGQPIESSSSSMFGPQQPSLYGQPGFNFKPESFDRPLQLGNIPGFSSPDSFKPGQDWTNIKLPSEISSRPIGSWLLNIFGLKHPSSQGQPGFNYSPESSDRPTQPFNIPGFGSTDSNKPEGDFINMQFPFEISGQPITISPSNMFGPQLPSSKGQLGIDFLPESPDRPMQPFNIPGFGSTDTNKPGGDFINLQFPSEISGQPIESSSSSMFGPQQPSLYGQPGFNFKPESFDRPLQLGNIPGFSSPDSFKPGGDWTNIKLPSEISSRPIGSWLLNIFGLKHPSSQEQPEFNYSPESSDRPTQPVNIPGFESTDSNNPGGDFINMQFPFEISGQPITISPSNMFGPQLPSSKGQLGIDFLPESPDRPMQPFNIPGFGSPDSFTPGGDLTNIKIPSEISSRPIGSWLSNIFSSKYPSSPGQPGYNFMPESFDRPSPFMVPEFGNTDTNKPEGDFINMQFPSPMPNKPFGSSLENVFSPKQPLTDGNFPMEINSGFEFSGQPGIPFSIGLLPEFTNPESSQNLFNTNNPPSLPYPLNSIYPNFSPVPTGSFKYPSESINLPGIAHHPNYPPDIEPGMFEIPPSNKKPSGGMFGIDNVSELSPFWVPNQRPENIPGSFDLTSPTSTLERPNSWLSSIFNPNKNKKEPVDGTYGVKFHPEYSIWSNFEQPRPQNELLGQYPDENSPSSGFLSFIFGKKPKNGKIKSDIGGIGWTPQDLNIENIWGIGGQSPFGLNGIYEIPEPFGSSELLPMTEEKGLIDSFKSICAKLPSAPFCKKTPAGTESSITSSDLPLEGELGSLMGDKRPVFIITQTPCENKKNSLLLTSLSKKDTSESSISSVIIPTNQDSTEWKMVRMPKGVRLKTLMHYFTRQSSHKSFSGDILNHFLPSSGNRGWSERFFNHERNLRDEIEDSAVPSFTKVKQTIYRDFDQFK